MSRRFPRAAGAAPLLLTVPGWAWAHSPVPGLGAFYSGMLHPVVAPSALIALLALGLLIGQHGLVQARKAVLGFVVAVALGLVLGSQWPGVEADPGLLLAALATAVCALAARSLPAVALVALAVLVGMAAGLGLADMAVGSARWVIIAGTWLGCAFLALGVAALAELARKPWQQIALRVVASWLAASALLVLGLRGLGPVRPAPVGHMPAVAMHGAAGLAFAPITEFFHAPSMAMPRLDRFPESLASTAPSRRLRTQPRTPSLHRIEARPGQEVAVGQRLWLVLGLTRVECPSEWSNLEGSSPPHPPSATPKNGIS